jgi:nicotinamidase-related amidase
MFAFAEKPFDGEGMLSRITGLVARAREANAPVIFVQHDGGAGHPLEKPNENWEVHLDTGYLAHDLVIEKRNCDAFQDTELQKTLVDLGIKQVVLAGMMTEYCVDTTCRRAFSLGYDVILAGDAHSTLSRVELSAEQIIGHHNSVLNGSFASVKSSAQIEFSHQEAFA